MNVIKRNANSTTDKNKYSRISTTAIQILRKIVTKISAAWNPTYTLEKIPCATQNNLFCPDHFLKTVSRNICGRKLENQHLSCKDAHQI